jgi:hypothetical protein
LERFLKNHCLFFQFWRFYSFVISSQKMFINVWQIKDQQMGLKNPKLYSLVLQNILENLKSIILKKIHAHYDLAFQI